MSDAAPEKYEAAGTSGLPQMVQASKPASDVFQIPAKYANYRDQVICYICGDFEPGLVYVCYRKHLFCRHCYLQCEGVCSSDTCKSPLVLAKDSLHDIVFDASTFKCIYAEHGCTQTVLGTHYTRHMASCNFRPGPRVPRSKKSKVIDVHHLVIRVTPEVAKAHYEQPSVTWSPELQQIHEEQIKQNNSKFYKNL